MPPARGSGYIEIRGPNNEAIATLFPSAGKGGVGFDVACANAQVIGAAPALLAALILAQRCIRQLEKAAPLTDLPGEYRMDAAEIIEAAISRAEKQP